MPLDEKEATLTMEENRVSTCGEELAIVKACPPANPHTPEDDCSTLDLSQVIHIHACTDLIWQHLRAVS